MNQKIEFIIRDRMAQIESRTVWSVTSSHSASIARDYKKHAQNMILKPCLYGHVFALLKQDSVFLFIILSALLIGQKVSLYLRSSQKHRRGSGKRMASTEKRKVLFYKIATKVNKNIFLRND